MKLHDTIAAIATPIGTGGIAILRISGSEAEAIAQRVAAARSGLPLRSLESHKLTLCNIHKLDQPEVSLTRRWWRLCARPAPIPGRTWWRSTATAACF